jgi:hypothetical protein
MLATAQMLTPAQEARRVRNDARIRTIIGNNPCVAATITRDASDLPQSRDALSLGK